MEDGGPRCSPRHHSKALGCAREDTLEGKQRVCLCVGDGEGGVPCFDKGVGKRPGLGIYSALPWF